jgi:hypothetical protein
MNTRIGSRLKLFGAAALLALAASPAMAQGTSGAKPQASAADKNADSQKPPAGGEKAQKPAKPAAAAGWATESEARAHCHGTVIWVDKDHFNHYAGSREYGRKPGSFACEKG